MHTTNVSKKQCAAEGNIPLFTTGTSCIRANCKASSPGEATGRGLQHQRSSQPKIRRKTCIAVRQNQRKQ
eukprot:1161580-Pelagomonas_calceolata.AAC.14